jgi:glutathione S-transferase
MMVYPAEGTDAAISLDKFPNVKAWVERCKATESWKRAEAKGGPASLEAFIK